MRILVLTNRVPYPLNDGGNVATMQMLQSLLHCGFEVKLLSLNTNKHNVEPGSLPPVFQALALESTEINTDVNFRDALLNFFSDSSYNAVRFYSEDFKNLIVQTLIRSTYDLVLFEGIYMAMYVDYVKQFSSSLCVLRPHNVEYEIWVKAAREESFLKHFYIGFLAKRLKKFETEHWKKFDAFITISSLDEMTIKQNNNNKGNYITLPTAIDLNAIESMNDASDINKIFHLGSMDWIPNQQAMEWFLERVWNTVETRTNARFYMAGRSMPEGFFTYRSDRIIIEGEVENAFGFMKDKQIMVVPLFAGSGVRIKILEGMAASKTIITTSLGVQGIDAYDQEHVMIANNPDAFADAIFWCLNNEKRSREIGRNARKLIEEKYSIEIFETKLKNFLSSIQTEIQ